MSSFKIFYVQIQEEAYIVTKKIPYDIIQEGKKVTKGVNMIFELFKFIFCALKIILSVQKLYITFIITFSSF